MAAILPTKKSITSIKSKLLHPSLTSHYLCQFTPPSPMSGFMPAGDTQQWISLSCSDAALPGSNFLTNEINDDYHGITERYAYRRSYDDRMDFTFYVDRDYTQIIFFEKWLAFISGENNKTATAAKNYFYRVNFPDNYITSEMYITKFERDIGTRNSGPTLTYQFINAFPININTMPVSYESSQLLKCTVSFSFSRYLIKKSGSAPPSTPPGPTPAPGGPTFPPIPDFPPGDYIPGNPPQPTFPPIPDFPPETNIIEGIPSIPSSTQRQGATGRIATALDVRGSRQQPTSVNDVPSNRNVETAQLPKTSTISQAVPNYNPYAGTGAVISVDQTQISNQSQPGTPSTQTTQGIPGVPSI